MASKLEWAVWYTDPSGEHHIESSHRTEASAKKVAARLTRRYGTGWGYKVHHVPGGEENFDPYADGSPWESERSGQSDLRRE